MENGYIIFVIGFIFILIILTIIISFIMMRKSPGKRNRPRLISLIVFTLFITHWIFYLSSGYSIFSVQTADSIFNWAWSILLIANGIIAISEFKNNNIFAIIVVSFTVISMILFFFITLIGNM